MHCLAGRDRTGLVSALLLRLVGVDIGLVAAEWWESEANLVEPLARWLVSAPDPVELARRRGWVDDASPTVMGDVLAELEARHGSAEGYLHAAGVTDRQLDLVCARLRG